MPAIIIQLSGWFATFVFPVAALIQLIAIIRNKSTDGVSWMAWGLFGLANICLFIYTEKYAAPQAIITCLGSAIIDFTISGLCIFCYKKK